MDQTKELLEARADQMITFEENINLVAGEVKKLTGMQNNFSMKIINDLKISETLNTEIKAHLNMHMEEYKSTQMLHNFNNDKNDSAIKNIL